MVSKRYNQPKCLSMDEWLVVCIDNGILLSVKKERNSDIQHECTLKTWDTKWNRLVTKRQILYDSTWEVLRSNHRDKVEWWCIRYYLVIYTAVRWKMDCSAQYPDEEDWNTKKLNNIPKITQKIGDRAGLWGVGFLLYKEGFPGNRYKARNLLWLDSCTDRRTY